MKTRYFQILLQNKLRIAFLLGLALLLTFAVTPRGYAQQLPDTAVKEDAPQTFPYKKTFVISAYYSPLPGQEHYATGSYEGDVRLNGEGVHSADGSIVYPGMIAAPRNFPFGTKIEIPGFGTGTVHDRGGAIKNSRLDIWLGHGDEGLRRALGWGLKTIEGTVYGVDPNIADSVNFTTLPLPEIAYRSAGAVNTKYFKTDISSGDQGASVAELQRLLKKLGFLETAATGYFGDETLEAVIKFQIQEKIIENAESHGAGNFGPRTRSAFELQLESKKAEVLKDLPDNQILPGERGEHVSAMQGVLNEFNFLANVTGEYNALTKEALIRLQLDQGIVESASDRGAGYYGVKTRAALENLINATYMPAFGAINNSSAAPTPTYTRDLKQGDTGAEVKLLQQQLKELGFFGLEPTGMYGRTTQHAVFKLQQQFKIAVSENEAGAGVTGPQTRDKLNELAIARSMQKQLIAKTTETHILVVRRIENERKLVAGALTADVFANDLFYGSRGESVEQLQIVLKRLGFFPGRLTTEYYGDITKNSISSFQRSHGLEETGVLDGSTRRIMNKLLNV